MCEVQCPEDVCEKEDCPQCETVCKPPQCGVTVPSIPSAKCEVKCEDVECEWSCHKPSDCPRPDCKLKCEDDVPCAQKKHVNLKTETKTHTNEHGEHVTETSTHITVSHDKDAGGVSEEDAGKSADEAGEEHASTAKSGVDEVSKNAGDAEKHGEEEGKATADEAGAAHAEQIRKAIDAAKP